MGQNPREDPGDKEEVLTLLKFIQTRWRTTGGLALLAVIILSFGAFAVKQFDPDFWWGTLVGQMILNGHFPHTDPFTFTAVGHRFIVQLWGSEVLLDLLYKVGMIPVILFFAIISLLGFLIALERVRRRGISPGILAVVGALGLAVGLSTFGPRSQMFTFLGVALLLFVLDWHKRKGGRMIWLLVPFFCIWGNLHGGFNIGLGLFFLVILAEFIEKKFLFPRQGNSAGRGLDKAGKRESRVRILVLVLLVSVIGLIVNPNGPYVYLYAFGLLSNSVAQSNLDEWRSPSFHDPTFLPLLILIFLLIVVAPKAKKATLADIFTAIAGVGLTLYAVRDLSILSVTYMPLAAFGIQGWKDELGRTKFKVPIRKFGRFFAFLVLVISLVASAFITGEHLASPLNNSKSSAYPVAVAEEICSLPKENLFTPYGSSGWILYEMKDGGIKNCPQDKVFIFGDVDTMGPIIFQAYLNITAGSSDSLALLKNYHAQLVWQQKGSPLITVLEGSPNWRLIWQNGTEVIFQNK